MSKNSRDPVGRRVPSDGAISTADLSPTLRSDVIAPGGGAGGGGGIASTPTATISFLLEDIDAALLAGLAVGQEVRFVESGRRIAAVGAGGRPIGFVPGRHAKGVREAMATAYRAWISELPHKAVRVSVGS